MTTTIRLEHHLSWGSVAKALFSMIVLSAVFTLTSTFCQHMYEKWTPTDYWFQYESVVPAKANFKKGDELKFISTVERKHGMYIRWEDTLYCTSNNDSEKYPTQYRPEDGYSTEYKASGKVKSSWKYGYQLQGHEVECVMCGTVIGKTPLGYEKIYPYCTKKFGVNK